MLISLITFSRYSLKHSRTSFEFLVIKAFFLEFIFSLNFNHEIVKEVIFNGILNTLNTATGLKEDFSFLSVRVNINQFKELNIEC